RTVSVPEGVDSSLAAGGAMNAAANESKMAMTDVEHLPARDLSAAKSPSRLRALGAQVRQAVLPIVAAMFVIGCWEAIVRIKNISNALLPAPSAIALRLVATLPFLLRQAIPTTLETIASFLISFVLGIGLA